MSCLRDHAHHCSRTERSVAARLNRETARTRRHPISCHARRMVAALRTPLKIDDL
jgi:hypothetical protein